MVAYYNTFMILFGGLTLLFGIWTIYGLFFQSPKKRQQRPKRQKIVLGVCADFSSVVGIPLWLVRLYAVVYAPLVLGIVFYLLYYLVMKLRKPISPVLDERSINVTRMEIHRY